MAWSYSDWVTLDDGTAKVTRLRQHIQEVADKLASPTAYSTEGLSVSRSHDASYLERLEVKLAGLEQAHGSDRPQFTRARATT